jgi:hypothetical protein
LEFENKSKDENDINEKENLLDLIKDKHSPWYAKYDWSDEANLIREAYISGKRINLSNIEEQFKTLRFVDKDVNMGSIELRQKAQTNEHSNLRSTKSTRVC